MNQAIPLLWTICCTAFAGPAEPVALENGTSPSKKYDVVLEADKDTPSFSKYEMKGDASKFPKLLVRDVSSKAVLQTIARNGDPHSDEQPLRSHTEVIWRSDSSALIINTNERHYSHTNVLALNPETGLINEVELPSYKLLTGFEPPKSDDLRASGHNTGVKWTADDLLVFELFLTPTGSYKGADPLRHRVFLRVKPDGMEVVQHEPITDR